MNLAKNDETKKFSLARKNISELEKTIETEN